MHGSNPVGAIFFFSKKKILFLRDFYIGIVEVAVFESKMHGSNPVRAIFFFSRNKIFFKIFLYRNR
jgi:uncharacterized membrane protein YhfC